MWRPVELPIAAPRNTPGDQGSVILKSPAHLDAFRLGKFRIRNDRYEVELGSDQSASKTKPFSEANCWVWIRAGHGDLKAGEIMPCFLFDSMTGCSDASVKDPASLWSAALGMHIKL